MNVISKAKGFVELCYKSPAEQEDSFRFGILAILAPILLVVFTVVAYVVFPLKFGPEFYKTTNFFSIHFIIFAMLAIVLGIQKGFAKYLVFVPPVILALISIEALFNTEILATSRFIPWYAGTVAIIFAATFLSLSHAIAFIGLFIGVFLASYHIFDIPVDDYLHRSSIMVVLSPFAVSFAAARKKLFLELAGQNDELVELSNMQTLAELSAGVAHEINNPLAIIAGRVQRVKSKLDNDGMIETADLREHIEKTLETVDRISNITKSLLKVAHKPSNKIYEQVSVDEVIKDSLSLLDELIRKSRVKFDLCSTSNDAQINCVPVQITQVIVNLISNGIHAVKDSDEPWIKMDCVVVGDQIELKVIDSGQGIPDAIAQKMMQPFFTTKGAGKGTGLGLSICKRILNSHGGELEYLKNETHTTFLITLPLVKTQSSEKKAV